MTTYIAPGELPSLNEAGLQGMASNGGNGHASSENGDVRTISFPPEKRPTKQAKTSPSKNRSNVRTGLSKRVRGRLSELPTMPLDILYEIFGHLLPSDLLSLSRVNKDFRHLLVSRRSLFLWKTSYKLIPDVPTCPEDMSEPAWAHLLFGGAYCYSCGAKPVTKILFSLRRRACKSCMRTHLLCASLLPKDFKEMFRSITVQSGSGIHPSRPWCTEHVWGDDVKAFQAEFDALAPRILDPDGSPDEMEAIFSEFLESKKRQAAYIQEHARICVEWEKERNADRSAVLSDVKAKRFEDIKGRFVELGYVEEDVRQLRWHREVSVSKPMSDRVWQRIEPLLIPEINRARDLRLRHAGEERYLERRSLVVDQFADFMGTLPPLHRALLPPFMDFLCRNRALAHAIALDSDPDNLTLNEQTREAISRLTPELETRKLARATLLRSLLPQDNALESATDEDVLAFATSVYECVGCHLRTSGLHILAHRCYSPQKSRSQFLQFSEEGRKTVEMLLKLMGLGKETTELELDRRKDRFVCMECPLVTFDGVAHPQRRHVRDWRSCVVHASIQAHKDGTWLLVGATETAGLYWDGDPVFGAYSCLRCPPRVDRRCGFVEWQGLDAVKEHIKKEHHGDEPLEGEDFFFDYASRRSGMTSMLEMPPDDNGESSCC